MLPEVTDIQSVDAEANLTVSEALIKGHGEKDEVETGVSKEPDFQFTSEIFNLLKKKSILFHFTKSLPQIYWLKFSTAGGSRDPSTAMQA